MCTVVAALTDGMVTLKWRGAAPVELPINDLVAGRLADQDAVGV
jgi:hypothetical protein